MAASDESRRPADLRTRMEQISLEQALADFEGANARAIELVERVVELEQEVARLQSRLALRRRLLGPARDLLVRVARAIRRRWGRA